MYNLGIEVCTFTDIPFMCWCALFGSNKYLRGTNMNSLGAKVYFFKNNTYNNTCKIIKLNVKRYIFLNRIQVQVQLQPSTSQLYDDNNMTKNGMTLT